MRERRHPEIPGSWKHDTLMFGAPNKGGLNRPSVLANGRALAGRATRTLCAATAFVGGLVLAAPVAADDTVHRLTEDGAALGTFSPTARSTT